MHFVDDNGGSERESHEFAIISCRPLLPTRPMHADLSSTDALNYLTQGVIITDRDSMPLWSNRVAHQIIDEADGLRIEADRLAAARKAETAAIRRLIATASEQDDLGASGVITVSRPSMRRSLALVVVPTRRSNEPCASAIVFINDPERLLSLPLDFLRQLYGLTFAEAAVVMEIAHGNGLQTVARKLGVAKSTARTHLQRAFHKTGTRRQSQLSWLIARCCAGLPLESLHRSSSQNVAGTVSASGVTQALSVPDDAAKFWPQHHPIA